MRRESPESEGDSPCIEAEKHTVESGGSGGYPPEPPESPANPSALLRGARSSAFTGLWSRRAHGSENTFSRSTGGCVGLAAENARTDGVTLGSFSAVIITATYCFPFTM